MTTYTVTFDPTSDGTSAALYVDVTYTVTFDLGDYGIMTSGQLSQSIAHGQNAIPPIFETMEGHRFTGWDSSYTNIQANATISAAYKEDNIQTTPRYRLYNPNNGNHHWTTSFAEYEAVGAAGWAQESFISHVFTSQAGITIPLYRLYNPNSGLHHYTTNPSEQIILVTIGWIDEGISAYAFPKSQATTKEP